MNFLGMGPMELMLIMVLALIVFGPGKLPEIAGQVGKAVRDVRRATTDLSGEFNRTLSLEIEEKNEARASAAPPPLSPPPTSAAPALGSAATDSASSDSASSDKVTVVDVPPGGSVVLSPTRGDAPHANGSTATSPPGGSAAQNGQSPALADTSTWHWDESQKLEPGADLAPPDRRVAAESGGAERLARKDPADLVPPY